MICPNCGFESDEKSKTCPRCGNKIKKRVKIKTILAMICFVLAIISAIIAILFINDNNKLQNDIDNCNARIDKFNSDIENLSPLCGDINDDYDEGVRLIVELDSLFEDIENYDNYLTISDKIEELKEHHQSINDTIEKAKPYADISNPFDEYISYFDEQYETATTYHTTTDDLIKISCEGKISTDRSMRDSMDSYSLSSSYSFNAYNYIDNIEMRINREYDYIRVSQKILLENRLYIFAGLAAAFVFIVIGIVLLVYKKKSAPADAPVVN